MTSRSVLCLLTLNVNKGPNETELFGLNPPQSSADNLDVSNISKRNRSLPAGFDLVVELGSKGSSGSLKVGLPSAAPSAAPRLHPHRCAAPAPPNALVTEALTWRAVRQ